MGSFACPSAALVMSISVLRPSAAVSAVQLELCGCYCYGEYLNGAFALLGKSSDWQHQSGC